MSKRRSATFADCRAAQVELSKRQVEVHEVRLGERATLPEAKRGNALFDYWRPLRNQ